MVIDNRTVFMGDNLDVMRAMETDSIDLIYVDPPFRVDPPDKEEGKDEGEEEGGLANFKNRWTRADIDRAYRELTVAQQPALSNFIELVGVGHSEASKALLTVMAIRLLEMKRILKPDGSLYIHCDMAIRLHHYIKVMMNAIFGKSHFKNEIAWQRLATPKAVRRHYGRVADRILYYALPKARWQTPYTPLSDRYKASFYRYEDAGGRYQLGDLTGARESGGESGKPWRGFDPGLVGRGRCWSTPKEGEYSRWIEEHYIPGYCSIEGVHARLEALDKAGFIVWSRNGTPRLKRYLAASKGVAGGDMITHIIGYQAGERMRYGGAMQKPLALLEWLIYASSREGDRVLDPFCGCGTTLIAAEKLKREWIGIDVSSKAVECVETRLKRLERADQPRGHKGGGHKGATPHEEGGHKREASKGANQPLPHKGELHEGADQPLPHKGGAYRVILCWDKAARPKTVLGIHHYQHFYGLLYNRQGHRCNGCKAYISLRVHGDLKVRTIIPLSKGGSYHLQNLQALCPVCYALKGDKDQETFLALLERFRYRLCQRQGHCCNGCKAFNAFHLGRDVMMTTMIPPSEGGKYHLQNLQGLCPDCKLLKGDKDQETFLALFERPQEQEVDPQKADPQERDPQG